MVAVQVQVEPILNLHMLVVAVVEAKLEQEAME
jgi:hypothetical protein